MSAWEDFRRNVKTFVNGDPITDTTTQQVKDRMLFPIGRDSVDVSTAGLGGMAPLPEYAAGAHNPIFKSTVVNPNYVGDQAPILAHEFRHKAGGLFGVPLGSFIKGSHEKITVLDILESQTRDDLISGRTYNQYFTGLKNKQGGLIQGDQLIKYLNRQRPWLSEHSAQAAERQGIPPAEGKTQRETYLDLANKLIRRTMTDPQTWPTVRSADEIEDPDFKKYIKQKIGIQKRKREIDLKWEARKFGPRRSPSIELAKPGPTRDKDRWQFDGVWTQ